MAPVPDRKDDLTTLVINVLIKRTKGNQKVSIPFLEAYIEACIIQNTSNHFIGKEANPDTRNQLLEYLLANGYVIPNPQEGEAVFITQKTIDKFYPT